MSLDHKAFIFDIDLFHDEFESILIRSLSGNDINEIKRFIESNKKIIKDPYEGELLDSDWEHMIEDEDAHQYGDFAITKYYSPNDDLGLGEEWDALSLFLCNLLDGGTSPILGRALFVGRVEFDPGKMGAYFQTKENVEENLKFINGVIPPKEVEGAFNDFKMILKEALKQGKGLYVTF